LELIYLYSPSVFINNFAEEPHKVAKAATLWVKLQTQEYLNKVTASGLRGAGRPLLISL
jgi:hypothetical protein